MSEQQTQSIIQLPESMGSGRPSKAKKEKFESELKVFADQIIAFSKKIGRKVSSRGWCYILESFRLINKSQFDFAEKLINKCRKNGLLPIDFVRVDETRVFRNVEALNPTPKDPQEFLLFWLEILLDIHEDKKDVGFWKGQECYIQMVVEKIDILDLFQPICEKYHIPIVNGKGWSSILLRASLAKRYKEAETLGLKPILLYYGDFDPAGLLIAETIKKNLKDIERGTYWNPENLIVDKFGLNYDFIEKHKLMWIDNLTTGSGNQADKKRKYVKEYIEKYGVRKVEANAVLGTPKIALEHCEESILKYLKNPFEAYDKEIKKEQLKVKTIMDKVNYQNTLKYLKSLILELDKKSES